MKIDIIADNSLIIPEYIIDIKNKSKKTIEMVEHFERLKNLEDIALDFNGVEKAYAIQAGRELRVMVESEKINDEESSNLSFKISQKIQTDMTYPGQVKVTVIREIRSINIAK